VSGLVCEVEATSPVALVRLAGRLDPAADVDLRTTLQKALVEQPSGIVVDVAGLTFWDDLTLMVFSRFASTAAEWSACPMVVCAPSALLWSALKRLAITQTVGVYPTRAQAVVAVEAAAARRVRQRLSATPAAPALARRTVVEACQAWGLPDLVDDAEVVVTELVANAVRHVGGDLHLDIALGQRFLHLSLRDGSRVAPVRKLPDPDTGRGGRGLILIDALAASWGSTLTLEGKAVWARLRLPG